MANTALPTNIQAGSTGRIAQTNILHEEVNDLSRNTGPRLVQAGAIVNGWKASSVLVQRIQDLVYVTVSGLDGTNATDDRFLAFGTSLPAVHRNMAPMSPTTVLPRFAIPGAFDFTFAFKSLAGISCIRHSGTTMGTYSAQFYYATRRPFPDLGTLPPAL